MISKITIEGDKDLQRLFHEMPINLAAQCIKAAGTKAGALIRKESRATTPVGPTGNLKRSIGIIKPKSRAPYVIVGPRVKRKGKNESGFHAGWIAHGTGMRITKRPNKGVGSVRGIGQWIQEAAGRVEKRVHVVLQAETGKIIDKRVRKYLKR